ncbi:winged helix-turn-helix transcriptional regulator [Mesorhizobium sp.]|uniref:winged helix-turn-helix transcriptional regulator n=1 Tax=Mesorhizobium sp. TaxID=1871066 RepID=UPI00257E3181|nr:winged helix-turn-helix transcriptional regulator [Mesorhizobium sp.]
MSAGAMPDTWINGCQTRQTVQPYKLPLDGIRFWISFNMLVARAMRLCLASEKVLTQQLRQMEADGLISRAPMTRYRPRVEYSITPLGFSLNDAMAVMSAWGKHHETWKSHRKAA